MPSPILLGLSVVLCCALGACSASRPTTAVSPQRLPSPETLVAMTLGEKVALIQEFDSVAKVRTILGEPNSITSDRLIHPDLVDKMWSATRYDYVTAHLSVSIVLMEPREFRVSEHDLMEHCQNVDPDPSSDSHYGEIYHKHLEFIRAAELESLRANLTPLVVRRITYQ